ncbi:RNA polymerase sigma factor [Rudanella lutea]|uniref:RNA polymerase sigma factor n=1 Tax=Rudanella lutea TaxID=451374 RepID=UPI00037EDD58|nr:sigma-70 family RNA polymerase sigma factor [Rudanella lutea]
MSGTKRTLNSLSDTDLLAGIKTGDGIERAMRFIYQSHYRMLESYVCNNSGDPDDAADLIQEVMVTFIELVQKDKFRGETTVKSFLYTLTRNLWISELRKRGNDAKRNEEFETSRDTLEADAAQYVMYKEAQKTIVALFDKLGAVCKQILTLFYYEDLSMKEIMERTEYDNEQVVRNRKYKCLKELTDLVNSSPATFDNIKAALQRTK